MHLIHVVLHSPGPNWKPGVDFREQPGVDEHVQHYAGFHKQGKLFLGGPYMDPDSGGMMLAADTVTREELEEYAASDPAVLSGLLNFEVKTWYLAMQQE